MIYILALPTVTELAGDYSHLRFKMLTKLINIVFPSLGSDFRNRFTTAEFQTRETTISGTKDAKQKEKK